jgi:hypothetical protein
MAPIKASRQATAELFDGLTPYKVSFCDADPHIPGGIRNVGEATTIVFASASSAT